MANEQNLKKISSEKQAREMGSRGGKASVKAKRERESARRVLEYVLSQPITSKVVLDDIKKNGLPVPSDGNYLDYLVGSIVVKTAKRGQMSDLQRLIEILGESGVGNEASLEKSLALMFGGVIE